MKWNLGLGIGLKVLENWKKKDVKGEQMKRWIRRGLITQDLFKMPCHMAFAVSRFQSWCKKNGKNAMSDEDAKSVNKKSLRFTTWFIVFRPFCFKFISFIIYLRFTGFNSFGETFVSSSPPDDTDSEDICVQRWFCMRGGKAFIDFLHWLYGSFNLLAFYAEKFFYERIIQVPKFGNNETYSWQ